MRPVILALLSTLFAVPLQSQWLDEPTKGIPRTADGRPNLGAPAPRATNGTADLSGLWLTPLHPGYVANIAADLEAADVQPWAANLFEERITDLGRDDPGTIGCLPLGPRHITGGGLAGRAKIVQTPALILILFEDLTYRQIFMDGRALPVNPVPSFEGYSVGRWEADTLVVESIGFKDGTWLDFGGHPHTEALRVTERYRRTDVGHMQRQVTLDDPQAFKKPITIAAEMRLAPDTELLEYVCAETPRERFHLAGRTAAEKSLQISPDILARYVGTYDFADANNAFGIRTLNVSLSGGQLQVDFNGKGRVPLVALSERMFSPRLLGTYEFVIDERGAVTHLLAHGVEGSPRAVRRR